MHLFYLYQNIIYPYVPYDLRIHMFNTPCDVSIRMIWISVRTPTIQVIKECILNRITITSKTY
jgi:hypothetical protein